MDDRIKRTIEKLKALPLDGGSHENLSAICSALYGEKPEFGWTRGACEWLRDALVGLLEQHDPDEWADSYLDEVGLMRLPKDADGEVIHVGDDLCIYGERRRCTSLTLGMGEWEVRTPTSVHTGELNEVHHYKPTVEDVLCEYAKKLLAWHNDSDPSDSADDELALVVEYAEKLREVMRDE